MTFWNIVVNQGIVPLGVAEMFAAMSVMMMKKKMMMMKLLLSSAVRNCLLMAL